MAKQATSIRRLLALATVLMVALAWQATTWAHSNGVTGKAQSPLGCSCHGSAPEGNGAVTVSITGPATVQPGSTNAYTISVTGGPASTEGGLNLRATAGTLLAGTGTKVASGELTHVDPTHRSWPFQWQAPATTGAVSFYAIALASDASSDQTGDSWDWYGDAVNTAFPINVSSSTGVGSEAFALQLAPPAPQPSAGAVRIAFTLPRAGQARIDVLDAGGRRVAGLLAAELPAGRHETLWAGRSDAGRALPAGLYLVRLAFGGRVLTTRLTRLR